MRKVHWFTLWGVITLMPFQVHSQTLDYGATIGLNFAQVSGNTPAAAGTRYGLVAGGYLATDLGLGFSIGPEVLFSMKGTSGTTGGVKYTYALNYLEVPLLIGYRLPLVPSSPVAAYLSAGPDFAFMLASDLNQNVGSQAFSQNLFDVTNHFDFNLLFGEGIRFNVNKREVGIEIRYSVGVNDAYKSESGRDYRNRVFAILVSTRI